MTDKPAPPAPSDDERVFLIYDRTTGRIVHRHSVTYVKDPASESAKSLAGGAVKTRTTASRQEAAAPDLASLLDAIGDSAIGGQAALGDRRSLAVLEVKPDVDLQRGMVDAKSGRVVPQSSLSLTAARPRIDGDGRDSTEIAIAVLDHTGATKTDFSGNVQVRTSHGKLSAPRGIVALKGGQGTITLTATHETIEHVDVTARCQDAPCSPARLVVSFD